MIHKLCLIRIKRKTNQIDSRDEQLKHWNKMLSTRVIYVPRDNGGSNSAQGLDDSKCSLSLRRISVTCSSVDKVTHLNKGL